MQKTKFKDILVRYSVATLGLVLVAVGVALSIKSDLGTAPVSCPPYVVSLWGPLSVGTYTIMMHMVFILIQVALLRKNFKLEYLMQIPAALVFGLLTDLAIWAFSWIVVGAYLWKMLLCLLSIVITAAGISLEVRGHAWMLAGEQTVSAISLVTKKKFRNIKIGFDVFLVVISMIFSWLVFNDFFGDGAQHVVIREGTLLAALCTGLCMRFTDPLVNRIFGGAVDESERQ